MQTKAIRKALENSFESADPAINPRDLIYPEVEGNLSEGGEYLDDGIRMTDQPYIDQDNQKQ